MKFEEFKSEMEKLYAKYFNGSLIVVSKYSCFNKCVFVNMYLAKDKTEESGGYYDNDMLNVRLMIDKKDGKFDSEYNMDGEFTVEYNSKSYLTKPEIGYAAYGRVRLTARKYSGDAEKILKNTDKFLKKLHDSLIQTYKEGKIHKHHIELFEKRVKMA